jgi:dTDP-glucose pyrophosphorylase
VKILVPMAGPSTLYGEAGHAYPKNLVEIDGRPLAEQVLERLRPLVERGAELICLVREEESRRFHTGDAIRLLYPEATVLEIPELDSGAACSALLAIELIARDEPLLVYNGDQVVDADLLAICDEFAERGLDGGVVVFDAVHPRWSYVKTDDSGRVIEAAEKRPISRLATAGTYWYRRGGDFLDAVMSMILKDASVEGRFFICPAFNEMILRQARIGTHTIEREQYFSLSTPQGAGVLEEHLVAARARNE